MLVQSCIVCWRCGSCMTAALPLATQTCMNINGINLAFGETVVYKHVCAHVRGHVLYGCTSCSQQTCAAEFMSNMYCWVQPFQCTCTCYTSFDQMHGMMIYSSVGSDCRKARMHRFRQEAFIHIWQQAFIHIGSTSCMSARFVDAYVQVCLLSNCKGKYSYVWLQTAYFWKRSHHDIVR